MHRLRWFLILIGFALLCATDLSAQDKKIEVAAVKYDELKQEILKHRGKVVLVDFWATNCIPCINALPHYVELQKKHAGQGLVVITVSVDPMTRVKLANKKLTENQVDLRNLILDEPYDVWTKKFDFVSLPFSYIFDRRGKWVRYRASEFVANPDDYGREVDKTVLQMLSEK